MRRAVRRAGIGLLAAVALTTAGGPALAAPVPALPTLDSAALPREVTPNPALIDAGATGRLLIHKYLVTGADGIGTAGDGTVATVPADATPLAGVVFTAARVEGVDLTTNAGWLAASAYEQGGIAQARQHLGTPVTSAPTDASGLTVLAGLPVGLYLVHEAYGLTSTGGVDPALVTSADFLVTVPMTNPDTLTSWMYDIHVYPKNSRVALAKTVTDAAALVPGRTLTYDLAADIPAGGLRPFGGQCLVGGVVDTRAGLDDAGFTSEGMCAAGATYAGTTKGAAYVVVDDLATAVVPGTDPVRHTSDYLEFAAADSTDAIEVRLAGVLLHACTSGTTGCDYQVAATSSRVTITMTDEGLQALAAAKAADPAAVLDVSLQARVKASVAQGTLTSSGSVAVLALPNTALLFPTGLAVANGKPVPSNAVRTVCSTLVLHKTDGSRSLAGAVFTLYASRADALARRNPLAVSTTTGADGLARIAGLHVSDIFEGAPADRAYWIVETTTPTGYVGLAAPVAVRLLSDGTTSGADDSGGYPVVNTPAGQSAVVPPPQPGVVPRPPGLAFTGADITWLLLLGLGLIGGGVAFAVAGRRRREESAH